MITACDIRLCSHDAWFQVKVSSLRMCECIMSACMLACHKRLWAPGVLPLCVCLVVCPFFVFGWRPGGFVCGGLAGKVTVYTGRDISLSVCVYVRMCVCEEVNYSLVRTTLTTGGGSGSGG